MTSQGTAHGRFTRAIQQRNLWAAETSLRELGSVSLEDALGYFDLLAEHGRLETEAPFLSLAESQLALAALASLCAGEREAVQVLRRRLGECGRWSCTAWASRYDARQLAQSPSTNVGSMNVRALGPGDDEAVAAAQHLFDGPSDPAATARFLAEPGHHLLVAYDADERPVGFVSGVEMTHPDKGTEMFLYELAVSASARRQGVGRALVEALAKHARESGCYGMFVFTDDHNAAARATYHRAGAGDTTLQLMLEWNFNDGASQGEPSNS